VIVDAHHHFWDPGRRDYPWMGDELAPIRRRFEPKDLKPLLAANGVDRTILVQTVSSLDETQEFLETAAASEFIAGVVGWVDLTSPSVARTIAQLRSSSAGRFLRGIRHQVHDESDPQWLLDGDVQRGIAAVGEAGLVYDLLVRTRELPAALETVRRHPEISFVIDHAAKPSIAGGSMDRAWEEALAPLSDHANVTCKISGLVTEADRMRWSTRDLEPYVQRVIKWFGPKRCMFGSDWPVCLVAASYNRVVTTMRAILGPDADVFGGTAARVYSIG